MKTILVFAYFLIAVATFAQVPKTDSEKLVGKWVSHDAGYAMELDFKSNGSGVVDGDVVTWTVKPGFLILVTDGDKQSYNLSFNENGFRVSGGNLDMPLNFKKINAGSDKTKSSQDRRSHDRT